MSLQPQFNNYSSPQLCAWQSSLFCLILSHFHKSGNIASTPAKPFHYITCPVSPLHEKASCQDLDLWYFTAFKMVKQRNCCCVPWKAHDTSTSINIDVFSHNFISKTSSHRLWFLLVLLFNSPDMNIKAVSCVTSAQLCSLFNCSAWCHSSVPNLSY